LPPTPRTPHPQNCLQHELPHVPQLSLLLSGVSHPFAGTPSQSPQLATQPLQANCGVHVTLAGQSVLAQHWWHWPSAHKNVPATQPLQVNCGVHATLGGQSVLVQHG
jgi:hypothetical protein